MISKRSKLQNMVGVSYKQARLIETKALLASSSLSRQHGALQDALSTTTYLSVLVRPCLELGLNIDAAVQYESSNVLWDQGEMTASIRVLKTVLESTDLSKQDITLGKAELLAKLVSLTCQTKTCLIRIGSSYF